MNQIRELTSEQRIFGKAVAEWRAEYFCNTFNRQAWLQIEEHMRQYFRKYNSSVCNAPAFEVYCCNEILRSLKEHQNDLHDEEKMAQDFLMNGFSSWKDERTDDYYYRLLGKGTYRRNKHMNRFVNFSNHPSEKWDEKQKKESEVYGKIVDIPFPSVDPFSDEETIEKLADQYVEKILSYNPSVVMCQGEYTLCFKVVEKLKQKRIRVVAACSKREVVETEHGKISSFHFVRYRQY